MLQRLALQSELCLRSRLSGGGSMRMSWSRSFASLLLFFAAFLLFLVFKRTFFPPYLEMATFHHVYDLAPLEEHEVNVVYRKNPIRIHVKERRPGSGEDKDRTTVLLLHGQRFSSGTWLELRTLERLAERGHRVVAVDLPGYGKSESVPGLEEDKDAAATERAGFLKSLISTLNLSSLVIVSPSMSGSYSLPFLVHHPDLVRGFVPVAPVHTDKVPVTTYMRTRTPTLIVYGQLDTGLGLTSLLKLKNLPDHEVVEIPNARHPAYLDGPDLFHDRVLEFLDRLDAEDLSIRLKLRT